MKLSNESYFSLNFMARKSRPNKEGEIPILLRITMNGQRAEIYTNRYISPDNWNSAKGQAKGKTKKDLELNRYLDTIRTKIFEIHRQLVLRNEMITPDQLKRIQYTLQHVYFISGEAGKEEPAARSFQRPHRFMSKPIR